MSERYYAVVIRLGRCRLSLRLPGGSSVLLLRISRCLLYRSRILGLLISSRLRLCRILLLRVSRRLHRSCILRLLISSGLRSSCGSTEVLKSCRTAAERLAVTELLNIAQTAADTLLACLIVREESDRDSAIAAAVDCCRGDDRLEVLVYDLGALLRGCGEYPASTALLAEWLTVRTDAVAVVNGNCRHSRHLSAELSCYAVLKLRLDLSVDSRLCDCITFGEQHRYLEFRVATVLVCSRLEYIYV